MPIENEHGDIVQEPNPTSEDNPVSSTDEVEEIICSECQEQVDADSCTESVEVEGERYDILCDSCVEMTVECGNCGMERWEDGDQTRYSEYGDAYCDDCYWEEYTSCESCDNELHRDNAYYSEAREMNFCEGCWEVDGDVDVDLHSYSERQMDDEPRTLEMIDSTRLVGLEVEAITTDWDFWESMDDDQYPTVFRPVRDGSISFDSSEEVGGSGVEFVMKHPSSGDRLYYKIKALSKYLDPHSFFVNRSCGLHVHVDARDCEWRELKNILLLGKSVQDVLYKMLPPSRSSSRWCKRIPMSRSDILNIESNSDFIDAWYNSWGVNPSMEKYNDSRYCGMNMHSRIINGSVEFRYHSGTTNFEKILNWVKICTAIVDVGKSLSDKNMEHSSLYKMIRERNLTYKEFFEYLNLDGDVKEYVDKRMLKFYDENQAEDYRVLEYSI